MSDYRKLKVWEKAQAVAVASRKAARKIRGADNVSFKSQIVRAAFSVPANIVEGNGVQTSKEYGRFVRIAINSTSELDYHLETAGDLEPIHAPVVGKLMKRNEEVRKMLSGLLAYLEKRARDEEMRKEDEKRKNASKRRNDRS